MGVTMDDIDEIYKKLGNVIGEDEFVQMVDKKVEEMSGLCDRKTAAMLVAHDLGATDAGIENVKIKNITEEAGNVCFIGKVISLFDVKEFNRNDGTIGKVGNLNVGDETGKIRVTLWDDKADLITTGNIEIGQCLQVSGHAKEGYYGTEVNVGKGGVISLSNDDVDVVMSSQKIADIKEGMGDVNIVGRLLNASDIKTFDRRDGTQGRVCNILIGDDTGKIRVTLWDDKTDIKNELQEDETVEVINGYAKVNNFSQQVEIQVGNHTVVRKSNAQIDYQEDFTPIADIIPGEAYSVRGEVSGLGDIKEFSRDDGTTNMVSNIYISDDTGRIRVALWGENATLVEELDIDTPIQIIDAYSKSGFNDEIELSAGSRSRIVVL